MTTFLEQATDEMTVEDRAKELAREYVESRPWFYNADKVGVTRVLDDGLVALDVAFMTCISQGQVNDGVLSDPRLKVWSIDAAECDGGPSIRVRFEEVDES